MDSSSDSDCDMEDISLFPISDFDVDTSNNNASSSSSCDSTESDERANSDEAPEPEPLFKPAMSLRQRRRSKSQPLKFNLNNLVKNESDVCGSPKGKWFKALKKAQYLDDPWEKFGIEDLSEEHAVRHRYNALSKQWKVDDVTIKMEKDAFDRGAMRSCFRLKKLSNFSHRGEWKFASNYVAKRYMEDVDREVYFEDVKLQMDAKLWGEEYNRHNPPKKVDIFQMSVLEFKNRPGCPLFHLEHFIEGNYIKYNSNSGFVEEHLRLTPQAFSHFTFERSGHQLIIVDIQGVDDLWTDPQIHTTDGEGYGDGNLGTRGMALFFHSHTCNSICQSLELTKFDLAESEIKSQEKFIKMLKSGGTVVKGQVEQCVSASPRETVNLTDFLARSRARNMSSCSSGSADEAMCSPPISRVKFCIDDGDDDDDDDDEGYTDEPMSPASPDCPLISLSPMVSRRSRVRFESESEGSTLTKEEDRKRFQAAVSRLHRPSSVAHELNMRSLQNIKRMGDSVLGQIHHDMAKYHDMGRFSLSNNDSDIDIEAALYHEQQAADLGVMEAIMTMADIYLGLQHDILTNVICEQTPENIDQGVEYMQNAADAGSRPAMLYLARAYETGLGLSKNRTQSWISAVEWYEEAISMTQADESGDFDATMDQPVYQLQGKVAELLMGDKFGLSKDPQKAGDLYTEAAEGAMAAMKGRLANKYYALAEEAWAEVEEE